MSDATGFRDVSTTAVADVLGNDQVMDFGVRPLWGPGPRIAGPAFTVRCPPGDNLMLHAAIYRAAPGSVIVVQSGDTDYAACGGNVCAVAQRRGIAGFVIDGVIRDVAEAREMGFPVYARGVVAFPGGKKIVTPHNERVTCGGVTVEAGDIVVADEEGVVVVPSARAAEALAGAVRKRDKEAAQSLDEWEAAHHERIEAILKENGFQG